MKRKTCLSILLVLAMLFSLAIIGGTSAFAVDSSAKPKEQIKLIASKFDSLKQTDSKDVTWYYAVADLDHNGCLEFIAASQNSQDLSTGAKIWTVSKDAKDLTECTIDNSGGASFPDLLTDTIDTYHVTDTDTWYYMVTDSVVVSETMVNTAETALSLKDGVVSYETYAVESTIIQNGYRSVTHLDKTGMPISAEQYNAAGSNAFPNAERSNTALEWLTADKAKSADSLTESYDVFLGTREPTEVFPVPKADDTTPVTPAPAPVQPDQPTWLSITKNPTNENRVVGEAAIFIAGASAFESLNWTFVSPDGGEYTPANFLSGSGAYINGEYSTTLTVCNLESWMSGWGAYCTFYYKGQTARTSTAYMFVSNRPAPTPQPQPSYGTMSGTAYKNGGWYAIRLQNGSNVSVSSGICKVEGQFYDGCSAIVYYTDYPSATNIYQVDIYGNQGLIIPDQPSGGHATGLIVPDGALGSSAGSYVIADDSLGGGYAGSQYYNNEDGYTYADDSLGGGFAGSQYYNN